MKIPEFILEHVALAPMTTIRIGGTARFLARCRTIEQVKEGLEWAAQYNLPVQVLGAGSNILFDDRGFEGLVLKLELRGTVTDRRRDIAEISVCAGEVWDSFVKDCVDADLTGIECLSGIPGMVGATPMQNVGAYGQEVATTILSVRGIDRHTLKDVEFGNEDCCFHYRSSRFKNQDRNRFLITEVVYRLQVGTKPNLKYTELVDYLAARGGLDSLDPGAPTSSVIRAAVLALRRRKSMIVDENDPNSCSVGSFFLNPVLTLAELEVFKQRCSYEIVESSASIPVFPDPNGYKVSAAWLVERAGFCKGYVLGGAAISENHALAFVNRGGGSEDILRLASMVQEKVKECFDISLEREAVVVVADGSLYD